MVKKSGGRNGFFIFMMELKSKQGYNFKNNEEVSKAADPLWRNMTPEQRKPYEQRAGKHERDTKYTSQGINIAMIEQQETEMKTKEQRMRHDIQKTVDKLVATQSIGDHYFYFIHINNFCYSNTDQRYYPAEIAVVQFNFSNGIEKIFHRLIKPGPLPLGYSYNAKAASDKTHQLPPPIGQDAENNTKEVFDNLIDFLTENDSSVPPVYTRDVDLELISNIMSMFCDDYGDRGVSLNVYSVEYLLFILKNSCAGEQVWPSISLSTSEIQKDVYAYTMGIGCEFHSYTDSSMHCSQSIVTRLAYVMCDNCCTYLDIELIPGLHLPNKAKVTSSRPGTSASGSYSIPDSESCSDYKEPSTSEYGDESDRCQSSMSAISSTSAASDLEQFPALGAPRRKKFPPLGGGGKQNTRDESKYQSTSQTANAWGAPSTSRRPFELPSALMEGAQNTSGTGRSVRGRGRNLIKNVSSST